MKISAITTLTDWTALAGCWGRPGVYRMVELLHIAGVRDVYWRVFNGGMAAYPSRVAQVQDRQAYDEWQRQQAYPQPTLRMAFLKECDFHHYDPIPDAVEAANRGVFSYLTKPYNSQVLLAHLERALDSRTSGRKSSDQGADSQASNTWPCQ